MGKAEQRTKDAAMAANLYKGDGAPNRVKARKDARYRGFLAALAPGNVGSAKYRRRNRSQ